jgi:hypothetical protein
VRTAVFKKNKFLFISVTIHLILMYVVAQSVMFPAVPSSPEKKPNIIHATLIFDLPIQTPGPPIEVIEEERPQPAGPEEERPAAATLSDNQVEPISEPQAQAPPVSPQPQAIPAKPEEEVQEELQKELQNDDVNKIKLTDKNMVATPSLEMRAPATNMARRHLSSFQQQQQERMAEQASRYYQQHKNSPVLNSEVKNPYMTEDEKFRDNIKLRVDCNSTAKKATAVLLGFLGGQIGCSKGPPIKGFIQDRINKKSHLPGQYRQEDKPRPQSVVIKKQP